VSTATMPSPSPGLLTVKDIAARLRVSPRTVWRLRDAGRLPAPIRFGQAVRWRENDVSTWIAQGCPYRRREVATR